MRPAETRFLRFLAVHLAIGVGVGWAIVAGLLWLDIAKLATLIASSPHAFEARAMLFGVFAVTFGGAALGSAIMGLGPDEADGPRGPGMRRIRLARRADGRVVHSPTD